MATNAIIKHIGEAPIDTKQYARQDGEWSVITAQGIEEAPIDTNQYARQDGDWAIITTGELGDYEFENSYMRNTVLGNGQVLYSSNSTSTLQFSTGFETIKVGTGTGEIIAYSPNASMPNLSIANIDAAGNSSLVTKEWVIAQSSIPSYANNIFTLSSLPEATEDNEYIIGSFTDSTPATVALDHTTEIGIGKKLTVNYIIYNDGTGSRNLDIGNASPTTTKDEYAGGIAQGIKVIAVGEVYSVRVTYYQTQGTPAPIIIYRVFSTI